MTEDRLIEETEKWRSKLKDRLKSIEPVDEEGEEFYTNIKAYIEDSMYFMQEEDYVRAFECVIWSWAWLEIGQKQGLLKEED